MTHTHRKVTTGFTFTFTYLDLDHLVKSHIDMLTKGWQWIFSTSSSVISGNIQQNRTGRQFWRQGTLNSCQARFMSHWTQAIWLQHNDWLVEDSAEMCWRTIASPRVLDLSDKQTTAGAFLAAHSDLTKNAARSKPHRMSEPVLRTVAASNS